MSNEVELGVGVEVDGSAVRSTPARVQLDLCYRDAVTLWVLCKSAGPLMVGPGPPYIARQSAERVGDLLARLLLAEGKLESGKPTNLVSTKRTARDSRRSGFAG